MRRVFFLVLAFATSACVSDLKLTKNADAAYQYQKEIFRHECAKDVTPSPPGCPARQTVLDRDYLYISASVNAQLNSNGGKLPKSARTKLKQIVKELQ